MIEDHKMKVRALANISGPMGHKNAGEEFSVNQAEGKDLVDRKVAAEVNEAPAKPAKAERKEE
jgi:hypothetical protein